MIVEVQMQLLRAILNKKKKKILLKLTGNPEVYLGPCQTCKMEFFAKIVKI